MEYHVPKNGSDLNCGNVEQPFLTISKAAAVADEGDIVVVHEGVYRECVTLERGTENPSKRIIYKAAVGKRAVIKGSEEIKKWEKISNGIYKTVIPNGFFRSYNPYANIIEGDWYREPLEYRIHTAYT